MTTYLARTTIPTTSMTGATFSVPFEAMQRADMAVFLKADVTSEADYVLQVSGVDYNWVTDSQFTFVVAPAAGGAVEVIRSSGVGELRTQFRQGSLSSADLNANAVQLLYLIQEAEDLASIAAITAIRVPESESVVPLPSASERSGKFLAFGVDGQPIVAAGGGGDSGLRTDLADPAVGAALVAYAPAHPTVYLSGTSGERLQREIHLEDYDVRPDYTDNLVGCLRALDAADKRGGATIVAHSSTLKLPFRVSDTLELPGGTIIQGRGRGVAFDKTITHAATTFKHTGTGYAFRFGLDENAGLEDIAIVGSDSSEGGIIWGDGSGGDAHQNGLSTTRRVLITGFTGSGATALDLKSCQRAQIDEAYIIKNFNSVRAGSNAGFRLLNSNVSSNDPAGKAYSEVNDAAGGVNGIVQETYWESSGGQKPFVWSNPGASEWVGGGFEAPCVSGSMITDPTVFTFGAASAVKFLPRTLDFFSSGDNMEGVLTLFDWADDYQYIEAEWQALADFYNYGAGGRSGVTSQRLMRPLLGYQSTLRIKGAISTTNKTLAQAKDTFIPRMRTDYSSPYMETDLVISAGGSGYDVIVQRPVGNITPLASSGAATAGSIPAVTGVATTTVYSKDYEAGTLGRGRSLRYTIAGKRGGGTAGAKTLNLVLSQVGGAGTVTVPITLAATATDDFVVDLAITWTGRDTTVIRSKSSEGSSGGLGKVTTDNAGTFRNSALPIRVLIQAVCATAGETITVWEVREEPRG